MKPKRTPSAAIFLAVLVSACSAGLDAKLDSNGSASLSARVTVPGPVAKKLRALSDVPPTTPFFDAAAVRKALLARKGMASASAWCPDPDSLAITASIADLGSLLAAPDIAGIVNLDAEGGTRRLSIRLSRDRSRDILALLPGIDPDLVDALSPPALGGGDYTKSEYRDALAAILGTNALPSLDAAAVDVSVTAPGEIVAHSGGRTEGSAWSASIPLLDLLVLEKPVEFSFSWR